MDCTTEMSTALYCAVTPRDMYSPVLQAPETQATMTTLQGKDSDKGYSSLPLFICVLLYKARDAFIDKKMHKISKHVFDKEGLFSF